jgi:NTP pyrophosphatase (non-canonical NTP hydrolase)
MAGHDAAQGLRAFQAQIEKIYLDRDRARGWERTFAWFVEEVGELARALHRGDEAGLKEEFADVAAWLVTLASIRGVAAPPPAAAENPQKPGNPETRKPACPVPGTFWQTSVRGRPLSAEFVPGTRRYPLNCAWHPTSG